MACLSCDRARSRVAWDLSKTPPPFKGCDAGIVIAQRPAEHFLCVLTEQRRRHGISGRRQRKTKRGFDVGHGACSRVRDLADAMARAHLGRVEGLLDGTKMAG